MSEEKLLKYYGCNSLSEFIDTYLDCETAFDLLRSQFKEIDRLNQERKQMGKDLYDRRKEIERLQNIIKEVREWLEEDYEYSKNNEICDRPRYYLDKFEEILDKENKV